MSDRQTVDLLLLWNWEYDACFIRLLAERFREDGLTFLAVTKSDIAEVSRKLLYGEIKLTASLDRASDSDPEFLVLAERLPYFAHLCLNHPKKARHACDKAAVHYDLIQAGLQTPYTIVLPPYQSSPDLTGVDLSPLGEVFVAKPAHGGGSEGVELRVSSHEQVQKARMQFGQDAFLLQAAVHPVEVDGKPAWFRVIHCCGEVFACLWDPQTHVYATLNEDPAGIELQKKLADTSCQIAATLGMDLFSSEIALTDKGLLTVVDYVNDPLDLRLQTEAVDGVPVAIMEKITARLAKVVKGTQFEHLEDYAQDYSV